MPIELKLWHTRSCITVTIPFNKGANSCYFFLHGVDIRHFADMVYYGGTYAYSKDCLTLDKMPGSDLYIDHHQRKHSEPPYTLSHDEAMQLYQQLNAFWQQIKSLQENNYAD